jgi:hypothetical protein
MPGRDLYAISGAGSQALGDIARVGHRPGRAACRPYASLDVVLPRLPRPATMSGRDLQAAAGAAAQTVCGIARVCHSCPRTMRGALASLRFRAPGLTWPTAVTALHFNPAPRAKTQALLGIAWVRTRSRWTVGHDSNTLLRRRTNILSRPTAIPGSDFETPIRANGKTAMRAWISHGAWQACGIVHRRSRIFLGRILQDWRF